MKLDIQWGSFAVVGLTVLAATVLLTAAYAGGVRLLETSGSGNVVARTGAYALFGVCIAAVLFGLWVIIPQFHG